MGVCLINHGGSNAPTILESNMRDQTAALKYLAEKQFERVERKHKRDLILVAILAPVVTMAVVTMAIIVA